MYVPTLPHPLCPRGHICSWPLTKNEVGISQLLGFTHQPASHSTCHYLRRGRVLWVPQLLAFPTLSQDQFLQL